MKRFWHVGGRLLFYGFLILLLVAFSAGVALLAFEYPLPPWALERISSALSSEDYLIRVDAVSVRLLKGVRVEGLRVLNRKKAEAAPFASASRIQVRFALGRLPWRLKHLVREVIVEDLHFPRLPEGYYIPDSVEFPGSPDFREVHAPVEATFPEIAAFRLKLVRPDVLAVRARRVDVAAVTVEPKRIRLSGIALAWPDPDAPMSLEGEMRVDMLEQTVRGHVHGQARQANIRPMLEALEITNAYQFIDAFTEVTTPVDATCQFDVNLVNNDLHLLLDLHPTGGFHHGVPFKDAHGLVDVRVFVRDTFQNARIVVGPVTANFPNEKRMEGAVVYENTNDIGYVSFDVHSTVSLSNALAVADVLTDGTLDCLQPETPPEITLKGMMAVDPRYCATNDLEGTLGFVRGTFFGVPLNNARTAFHVKGASVSFSDARAQAHHGGELSGSGWVKYPGFEMARATFGLSLQGRAVALADLFEIFDMAVTNRAGLVDGTLELTGPLGDAALEGLSGKGMLSITKGNLAHLNLFTGLFDAMEKTPVPGLPSFVHQARQATGVTISEGTLSFTLAKGVFASDDLVFSGGIFTIACKGTYDYLNDKLDMAVRVKIVKDDSLFGMLKNPILWPFSRLSTLLFGFRATGSLEQPKWKYDTAILNRFR